MHFTKKELDVSVFRVPGYEGGFSGGLGGKLRFGFCAYMITTY